MIWHRNHRTKWRATRAYFLTFSKWLYRASTFFDVIYHLNGTTFVSLFIFYFAYVISISMWHLSCAFTTFFVDIVCMIRRFRAHSLFCYINILVNNQLLNGINVVLNSIQFCHQKLKEQQWANAFPANGVHYIFINGLQSNYIKYYWTRWTLNCKDNNIKLITHEL